MITIVSGIPRSGTSLMMRMLWTAGLPVLIDQVRPPDVDNPRGYFEWDRIRTIAQDPHCIRQAEGKAVKVVSTLLVHLPRGYEYRIIFMRRPLDEVIESQNKMLARLFPGLNADPDAALEAAFQHHLRTVDAWLRRQPHLYVDYCSVIDDPAGQSKRICNFAGIDADRPEMARCVEPDLYRNRISNIPLLK